MICSASSMIAIVPMLAEDSLIWETILEKALDRKLILPERKMRKLEKFFKAFPKAREVFIDETERPIQRPKNKKEQKENYSDKKKNHTSPDNMPTKIKKHLDLEFKGFQKQFPCFKVFMPERKPRTKNLTGFAKGQNKKKSSVRVLVENALAGVKRLRIVTDVSCNKKKDFDDQAMLISCRL